MIWAPRITSVRWARPGECGNSPAAVYRATGVMILNPAFGHLTLDQWRFIALHEMGHIALQTSDEYAVDEWAHKEAMRRGYSLRGTVRALTGPLNGTNPHHRARAWAQLRRAQASDTPAQQLHHLKSRSS